MKRQVDPAVTRFIDSQPMSELFLPSLVVAEIRYGLHKLPEGRRRSDLEHNFEDFLAVGFDARILAFGAACAAGYAVVRAAREQCGRPVKTLDALIGGIAHTHGATLATRNIADFEGYGLSLINPWRHS